MNYIIGINGNKNSGKDTVASMINYIFAVGITKSNYSEWITKRVKYDLSYSDRIIHFADPLKDILSILYNIPRKYFDDREYKDELYYCINGNNFVDIKKIKSNNNIITINDLEQFGYNNCIKRNDELIFIKLRTLMQYVGTNIFRNYLSDDIWIKSSIYKIIDKAESRKLCIVPDIRFENELNAINNINKPLYGGVIKIYRENCDEQEHISENNNLNISYVINNNGSLFQLFYKVLNYIKEIY